MWDVQKDAVCAPQIFLHLATLTIVAKQLNTPLIKISWPNSSLLRWNRVRTRSHFYRVNIFMHSNAVCLQKFWNLAQSCVHSHASTFSQHNSKVWSISEMIIVFFTAETYLFLVILRGRFYQFFRPYGFNLHSIFLKLGPDTYLQYLCMLP